MHRKPREYILALKKFSTWVFPKFVIDIFAGIFIAPKIQCGTRKKMIHTRPRKLLLFVAISHLRNTLLSLSSRAYIMLHCIRRLKSVNQNCQFIITELFTCMCSKRSSGRHSGRTIKKELEQICLNIFIYSICAERTSFLSFARQF